MKSVLKWALPCLCLATSMVGCSDDKTEEERQGKPVTELTPDENKKELDKIGQDLLAKIHPADHKQLIQFSDYFAGISESLEIEEVEIVQSVVKTINRVCAKSDLGEMMAFTGTSSELYKAAQFYGIYKYDTTTEAWTREDSNTSLEFHFKYNKEDAVIKIAASGKEVNVDVDGEQVAIPENVDAIVTVGATELCRVQVNSQLDNAQRAARVTAALSASGYVFSAKADVSKTKATCEFSMTKNGENILSATANVDGQNMTDPSDSEMDHPETLFRKAWAKINILEDATISTECSNIKNFVEELDAVDHSGDYTSSANSSSFDDGQSMRKEADIYNKYIKSALRYVGSDAVIFTIDFQASVFEEFKNPYYSTKDYELEPILVFTQDSSRYSFESYFDEVSFKSLMDSVERLSKEYDSFIN